MAGVAAAAEGTGRDTTAAAQELIRRRLQDSVDIKQQIIESECVTQAAAVAERIVESLRNGGKVVFFGNGGSSMDAGHLAAELLGRFYYDRPSLPAVSLPDATAAMTAIGNDYDYAEVFSRQVRGVGRAGDVAVGLSTSGNSPNVLRAMEAARELGMFTVSMTGANGGKVRDLVDVSIRVPTDDTPRIQEACMHLGHTICEIVEARIFPKDG
ncbi:MAG: SIS domain-containing protein [Actinomycetota bacterium]|nr:SIS domain-containing protein [Actinomycetota bacterium]